MTANNVGVLFVKLLLWVTRRGGVQCRDCGISVPVDDVPRFVSKGCLVCESKKLSLSD